MEPLIAPVGVLTLAGLGLVFGLKHAIEADHVVAVSAIVSEHRSVSRSALVGGLWGAGHTASLLVVGVVVLVFRVAVPDPVAKWLEFGVAVMIVALGASALLRVLRRRPDVHLHRHSHDGESHVHLHVHEKQAKQSGAAFSCSHAISQIGFKPVLVGTMHGLAGSAALTLVVLTQTRSVSLGLLYLTVFGFGSALGMLLMSGLIGLPFAVRTPRISHFSFGLQTVAGATSIAFGLWYAYVAGIAGNF